MKKIIIVIILSLLLVSCGSKDLENEVVLLKSEVISLKEEIVESENIKETINLLENEKRNNQELLQLELEKSAAYEEKIKSLEEKVLNSLNGDYFDYNQNTEGYSIKVINASSNHINYVLGLNKPEHSQSTVVIGYETLDFNPPEVNLDTIEIGHIDYLEALSFDVYGSIYDFEFGNIVWSEDYSVVEEFEAINTIDTVTNKKIIIHGVLVEGLPSQMVRWKNSKDEVFTSYLSYDGFGLNGEIIISN